MLIKALNAVATKSEARLLENVSWGKASAAALTSIGATKGMIQNFHKGTITAIWKYGCSLTTKQILLAGDNIWITARDEFGRPLLSLLATVVWTDNIFRAEGHRCEVRFHDQVPAEA